MSIFKTLQESYHFNRARTEAAIDRIESCEDPQAALGWRPGPDRAHVAWQLMHIGITEEIFATERLNPSRPGQFTELWPRFRGGSTVDDQIPSLAEIRKVLSESRTRLLETLDGLSEADLETIPEALKERKLTVRMVLHILSWHESHHQGQSHLTLNLFEAQ